MPIIYPQAEVCVFKVIKSDTHMYKMCFVYPIIIFIESITFKGCCHTRLHVNIPGAPAAQTTGGVGFHHQATSTARQDWNQLTADNLQMEKPGRKVCMYIHRMVIS